MMDLSSLQNIVDYRFNVTAKPTSTTSVALDVHQQYLETTNDYWYNVAGVPGTPLGPRSGAEGIWDQPQLQLGPRPGGRRHRGWTVHRGLLLEAGLGHFFRGDYVKQSLRVVGSKDANYCYVQATLNL